MSLHYMPAVFLNERPSALQENIKPEPPKLPGPDLEERKETQSAKLHESVLIPTVIDSQKAESKANKLTQNKAGEDLKIHAAVRRLINWENHVKQHEQAHMAIGGGLVSAVNYAYTIGPDGKRYVSGGEVSIAIPGSDNPEDQINNLERAKRAALAPANPSPQDIKTAAMAAAKLSTAYISLTKQQKESEQHKESEHMKESEKLKESETLKEEEQLKGPKSLTEPNQQKNSMPPILTEASANLLSQTYPQ